MQRLEWFTVKIRRFVRLFFRSYKTLIDNLEALMSNVIKVPSKEKIWVLYRNTENNVVAVLTSKPDRETYYLYQVCNDGSLVKLGKSKSPSELESKYQIWERMHTPRKSH